MKKSDMSKPVYKRIVKLVLITALLMSTIMGLLIGSYQYYKDMVVKSELSDSLNIVTTVSSQLEVYFAKRDHYIRQIIEIPRFQEEFLGLTQGEKDDVELVDLLFRLQSKEYVAIELIDINGALLKAYTERPNYIYRVGRDIEKALRTKKKVYFTEIIGDRSFNMIHPIEINGELYGFIRIKLDTNHIFDIYVADYKLHEKGYISLKDSEGKLLFHPSNLGIGEDVLEVRKRQFPDYDWSELETIVKRQVNRETGVGMYYSTWPGEKSRVRKLSAFTPCEIGDTFLILNLSVDYTDTISNLTGITNITIVGVLLLLITGLVIIGYIYNVEIRKNTLMVEAQYLTELKEKNALLMHQSKFAAMGEMLAMIAHQLKQPLNALKLSLYNIEDYHELKENDETYLKSLMASNRRFIDKMAKTIDDFKFFFQPQDEKNKFNIYDAIRFAIDLNIGRINNLGVTVNVEGIKTLEVRGESNIFTQVVLNVLNNSIDAMAENTGEKKIDIYLEDRNEEVCIMILDTGGGIKEEVREQLFEPYITTKGNAGTGLGLYISRIILKEKFNGELLIENTIDGVKAIINLPKGGKDWDEQ